MANRQANTSIEQLKGGEMATANSNLSPRDKIIALVNRHEGDLREAMPGHANKQRLIRVMLSCLKTTPKLIECHQATLLGSVLQCAQLGLEPNTALGHAYLVPFRNRKERRTDCQVVIGYKGFIDLARRSKQITSLQAQAVREGDHFDAVLGTGSRLEHKPNWDGDRGAIKLFYAVADFVGGGHAFEVMSKAQIDAVMHKSQSRGEYGPWKDHYEEMGRKTVIRRLAKYLPLSIEMAKAVAIDDAADDQRDQNMGAVLDGEWSIEPEGDEPREALEHNAEIDAWNAEYDAAEAAKGEGN